MLQPETPVNLILATMKPFRLHTLATYVRPHTLATYVRLQTLATYEMASYVGYV